MRPFAIDPLPRAPDEPRAAGSPSRSCCRRSRVASPPRRRQPIEWTVWSGLHLDAWSADDSSGQGTGTRSSFPSGIFYDTPLWGLVRARQRRDEPARPRRRPPSASITGFTDTTVSGYYRLRVSGTRRSASASTSTSRPVSRTLKTRDLAAIQDEDLVAPPALRRGLRRQPDGHRLPQLRRLGPRRRNRLSLDRGVRPHRGDPRRRLRPRRRAHGQRSSATSSSATCARLIGRVSLHHLQHGRAGRHRDLPGGRRDRHRRESRVAPGALVGAPVACGTSTASRPSALNAAGQLAEEAAEQPRQRDPRRR